MDHTEALTTLNDQFIEAFRQGSWGLLEPVLSPGFAYLDGSTGEVWTHERYVDNLRSHPSPSLSIDQLAIHVDGDTAVVSARTSRQPGTYGRYVDTYQRRGEEWLCVHACVWPLQQSATVCETKRPVSDAKNFAGVSIVPQLSVRRGREAVEFYTAAFGAVEVYRVGGTDNNPEVVAQLSIGSASFWVSDEAPASANFSPESVGGGTVRVLLIVDDPNAALEQAKAAGATEVYPVTEEHDWRLGRVEDPFGHHWEIGKPLIGWPPADASPHGNQ